MKAQMKAAKKAILMLEAEGTTPSIIDPKNVHEMDIKNELPASSFFYQIYNLLHKSLRTITRDGGTQSHRYQQKNCHNSHKNNRQTTASCLLTTYFG